MKLIFNLILLVFIKKSLCEIINWKDSSQILLSNYTLFNYDEITNLIVFGDSHSAVETNFTDMTYSGKNRSLGKNWPLHLIGLHNMTLWDFAVTSSTINNNTFKKNINFKENQYNYFNNMMIKGKRFYNRWNSSDSLFTIWIGNVDIKNITKYKNIKIYSNNILNDMFKTIEKLYKLGARNILLMNIFPYEKTPYNIN
eukprot:jgi/Orpsp1_1/1175810/evm.model.c7180000055296.1